jgi:D-alanyl-lipoteichoic acid acyltransferase DltB (MBOAT superfamily)
VYWLPLGRSRKAQNLFLLAASYLFYGWWDYRFLALIFVSSAIDYFAGSVIHRSKSDRNKNVFLGLSMLSNLGMLFFFKYYNFFTESLQTALHQLGLTTDLHTLSIILPVGISFYTFQTMSYTIDIYRGKLEPCEDPVAFFAFVSFFPQLVAGPIERAANLLPQFSTIRVFTYGLARNGVLLILWGLVKKVVVADQCAILVDQVFTSPQSYSSFELVLGSIFFTIQIYCDFSGYSDIATGTAALFGFSLMRNFRYPLFSRDIAEFWRRWHISLSTWFKDYVFIPLGGSRGRLIITVRNLLVVFLVSGLWHGANWTFVIWGLLHVLYYLPVLLTGQTRAHSGEVAEGRFLPPLQDVWKIAVTFIFVVVAFVFFRAASVSLAWEFLRELVRFPPEFGVSAGFTYLTAVVILFLSIEWANRHKTHPLELPRFPPVVKYSVYGLLCYLIIGFSGGHQEFIYFQF